MARRGSQPSMRPFHFTGRPFDDDGFDVAGMAAEHQRGDRIAHRGQIEGMARDQDEIGGLSRA